MPGKHSAAKLAERRDREQLLADAIGKILDAFVLDSAEAWPMPAYQTLLTNLRLGELDGDEPVVLETGCGTGAAFGLIHHELPPNAKFVATDLSPMCVKLCKAIVEENFKRKVETEVLAADALDLPLENGSVDRYLSSLCLHVVADPMRMMREARRVLRPRGIAAFTTWGAQGQSVVTELHEGMMEHLGLGPFPPALSRRRVNHLARDEASLRKMFHSAGFSRCILWHQLLSLPVTHGGDFARQCHNGPSAEEVLGELSEAQTAEVFAGLAKLADERLSQGDPLALDVIVIIATV